MKNAFIKDSLRQVGVTINRFIAILSVTMLGVAFFAGLKATAPDMRVTAQNYFNKLNFMDINLLSTAGFTSDDISAIKTTKDVKDVMPAYSADAIVNLAQKSLTVKLMSIDLDKLKSNASSIINRPEITSGRMPENAGEILADPRFLTLSGYKVGDSVTFKSGSESGISDTLKISKFTIVGVANDPLYISYERGSSTIGNGRVDAYFILPTSAFSLSVYTDVYLTVDNKDGLSRFDSGYDDLIKPVSTALDKISDSRTDIRFSEIKSEAQKKIDDAKAQLTSEQPELDASAKSIAGSEAQLAALKKPVWYVLDHNTNAGFVGFKQDADRIAALANVFPLIFFLVAALVSLTTMTRLVEDDRTYIGTMKALGYSRGVIAAKYLVYALAASLLGSVLGLFIGFNLFPRVVFNAYGILYTLPKIIAQFNIPYAVISAAAAVLCAALPAYLVCVSSLRTPPASLMRPKVPNVGKRILLERIKPLWKRFNFSQKVTARNLFRYKKRLIMTIVGVAGCTALIFTGFGLRDSISTIVGKQYDQIRIYDMEVDVNENAPSVDMASLNNFLSSNVTSSISLRQQSVDVLKGSQVKSAYLVVPKDDNTLKGYINLRQRVGARPLALQNDTVIISEKLASVYSFKVGDSIDIRDSDGTARSVKVGGICENYLFHYVYMSPTLYEKLFGKPFVANQLLCKLADKSKPAEDTISKDLMKKATVSSVAFTTNLKDNFQKMIVALRYVVLVLILSAAALAFVVLFSLTSINIDERNRELATIKVLGFYNSELAGYIYRENMILTVLSSLIGIVLGIFMQRYVILTAEVDLVMFSRDILWQTYLYSAGLTIVFAAFVNAIMYTRFKKIDMVSSLKSIE